MQKKHMTKILHPLLIETLSKLENKGNYLKGGIYIFKKKKTYDDFIITVEKKKDNDFPLIFHRIGKKIMSTFIISIWHCTGSSCQCNKGKERKSKKGIQIGKEEIKLLFICMATYVENLVKSTKKVLKTNKKV